MDTSTLPSAADAYGALQAFNSSRPSATDYISKANTQYNIPQDQQEVTGLQGTLNNLTSSLQAVAPSVIGRTSGTFTTAGQQSALVNKEQAPIATNISNTGTSLSTAQGTQSHDEQLASQMVQALLGQDATKYQGLMDSYNASTDAEKAAEQKREFDAQAAEQAREFNLTPHGTGGSDISDLINAMNGGNSATAADPTQNPLYKQVFFQPNGQKWGDQQLISDYNATYKSAQYGNARDQQKIALYKAIRPDLFGGSSTFKNATVTTPLAAPPTVYTPAGGVSGILGLKGATASPGNGNTYLGTY